MKLELIAGTAYDLITCHIAKSTRLPFGPNDHCTLKTKGFEAFPVEGRVFGKDKFPKLLQPISTIGKEVSV